MRIVLVDDHRLVCDCLRLCLERSEIGAQVVDIALDGHQGIEAAVRHRPDIMLMDVVMPVLNGVEATRQIVSQCPQTHVIGLSMSDERANIARMLKAGARGYLLKTAGFDEVLKAIETVKSGQVYISNAVATQVYKDITDGPLDDEKHHPVYQLLTDRERQVLQMIAEGFTTKQCGARLGVSSKTIETHRHRMMRKLNVRSVAHLTKTAIKAGLTTIDF